MLEVYDLREFSIEEVMTVTVSDSELTEEELELETTTNLVRLLLGKIESDKIENDKLIEIYDGL